MTSRSRARIGTVPLLVLISSLLLTSVAVWAVHRHASDREESRFQLASTRIEGRVLERLDSYLGVVWAAAGLFEANSLDVSDAQLRRFRLAVESGNLNDGLVHLTFVRKVEPENVATFLQNTPEQIKVRPEPQSGETLYVITHVQPEEPENLASLGFNPHSEPNSRKALDSAAKKGIASITDAVQLERDRATGESRPALTLYAPVYHPGAELVPRAERTELLFGFMGASFYLSDLESYLNEGSNSPVLGYRVYSGLAAEDQHVLFESSQKPLPNSLHRTSTITFSGNSWTIEFWSLPDLSDSSARFLGVVIGVLGVLLSVALFASAVFQARARLAREEALHYQRQRTEDLEEQARTKSRFFRNLNHELRTPLNGILGMSELLSETELEPGQEDYLRSVAACAQSLLDLINDTLDFSKIEAGKMSLKATPTTVKEVFRQAYQVVRAPALTKGIELRFEWDDAIPRWALLDGPRLRQVLVNLLGNAVKFTQSGSVTLRARRLTAEGESLLDFEVEDTGIGIPEEDIDKLFLPFSQLDSGKGHPERTGTGLGLHICKRLLGLMDGHIRVESQAGKGTRFVATIPLQEIESNPYETNSMDEFAPEPFPAVNILVVDDNPINCKVVSLQLAKLGLEARTASGGAEAVELVSKGDIDLVLMDCQMPGVDGLEATRRIRQAHTDGRPLIVALTAVTDSERQKQCREAGMDDFLTKPIEFKRLEKTLRTLLSMMEDVSRAT